MPLKKIDSILGTVINVKTRNSPNNPYPRILVDVRAERDQSTICNVALSASSGLERPDIRIGDLVVVSFIFDRHYYRPYICNILTENDLYLDTLPDERVKVHPSGIFERDTDNFSLRIKTCNNSEEIEIKSWE